MAAIKKKPPTGTESAQALADDLCTVFKRDDIAMTLASANVGVRGVFPTGITPLDRYILGVGGLPWGRVIEMYGGEGAGKSSVMNMMLAGCQRIGGQAVLVEVEHAYDPEWARMLGVNTDELLLLQPDYMDGEAGMFPQIERLLAKTKRPMLIAVDSVAACKTKKEFDEGLTGDAAIGEQARIWSRSLRQLSALLGKHRHGATLLLINQVRMKIGVLYGNPETTPGGNAIKFYASVRLNVRHGKGDGPGARYMGIQAMKNKLCPPFRKAELKLDYATGFSDKHAILHHAKDVGCVPDKCQSIKTALANLGWTDVVSIEQFEADLAAIPEEEK
jgi:recombination protein RecA